MRYFFRVEYDGTRYGGWQTQTNAPSIQETIVKAFSVVTRQRCAITGAGRTDAGVHALAQGAHMDLEASIDADACELSVNAVLPADIAIYHLQPAADGFHARFSPVSRRYAYHFALRKKPLHYKRVWMVFYAIDWGLVRQALPCLLGTHDFSAFCAAGSSATSMLCTVSRAELSETAYGYCFTIEADRFLYKMVRTIVGTLIGIGRGKITQSLTDIINSKNRACAGETAPACGLVLEYVAYEGMD